MEVQVPSLLVVDVVVAVGYRVLHLVGVFQRLKGCLVDLVQLSRHGLHVGVTRARVGVKFAGLSQFGAQVGKVALLDLARLVAYRPLLEHAAGVGDGAVELKLRRDALGVHRPKLPQTVGRGVHRVLCLEVVVTHVHRIEVVGETQAVVVVAEPVQCSAAARLRRAAHRHLAPCGYQRCVLDSPDGRINISGVTALGTRSHVLEQVVAVILRDELPDVLVCKS